KIKRTPGCGAQPTQLFICEAIGKERSQKVGSVSAQESCPSFRHNQSESEGENRGDRLKKDAVKRTNPGEREQLDQERGAQQAHALSPQQGIVFQAEPGSARSDQENEKILPFFAHYACGAGVIGEQAGDRSFERCQRM